MKTIIMYLISARFITSVAMVVLAVILWIFSDRLVGRFMKSFNNDGKSKSVIRGISSVVKAIIIIFTVLTVLQINNINVTSMIASLGLASAIVGLALQDILKDVIMGVHIVTDKFFTVGDVVKYGDTEGTVISFNMKTTKIKDVYTDSVTTVCNRNISEVTVISAVNDIDIPLSYEENTEKAETAIKNACEKIKNIDGISDITFFGFTDFKDSAVNYKVRFSCPPEQKMYKRFEAIQQIRTSLSDAGIEIPYNQLDVHTK